MSLAYPWAGETPRPAFRCTLIELLFARACVDHRFALRQAAFRKADAQ